MRLTDDRDLLPVYKIDKCLPADFRIEPRHRLQLVHRSAGVTESAPGHFCNGNSERRDKRGKHEGRRVSHSTR